MNDELIQKYNKIFIDVLDLTEKEIENAEYKACATWGSLNHLVLVSEIEDTFGCTFSRDDILNFSSYSKGIEILRAKGVFVKEG